MKIATKLTTDEIEAISAALKSMPVVEKKKQLHSKQDAILMLKSDIKLMQKRGYTLEQVAETLTGKGLAIATPTLKSYMQRANPATVKKPAPTKADTPRASPLKDDAKKTGKGKGTFEAKPDTSDI